MYLLDANPLYYAAGLSRPSFDVSPLVDFVMREKCCISSTTLCELLTNKKNDIEQIRAVGQFMTNAETMIAVTALNPFPDEIADCLSTIRPEELASVRDYASWHKVEHESRYASAVFDACLTFGLYFYMELRFPEHDVGRIAAYVKAVNLEYSARLRGYFADGYCNDDPEKYISRCFSQLLTQAFEVGLSVLSLAEDRPEILGLSDERSIPILMEEGKRIRLKIESNSLGSWTKKQASRYRREMGIDRYSIFERDIFEALVPMGHPEELLNYLSRALKKIVERGGVYKKNDFLDAVVLECLNSDEIGAVITFDGGLIDIMRESLSENLKYQRSLSLVEELRSGKATNEGR